MICDVGEVMSMYDNSHVVLLNADFRFISMIHWKKAVKLVFKNKAQIIKAISENSIIPKVIKLIKFIRQVYKRRVPPSKKNICIRDGFVCAYCGKKLTHSEVDHIHPASKGGELSWDNCVACCHPCNEKKGNMSLRESGMFLRHNRPYEPTVFEFANQFVKYLGVDKLLDEIYSQCSQ